MSNVRLSNTSPTLERMDRGERLDRPADNTRLPVRRNLFGSELRGRGDLDFVRPMHDTEKAFTERWNFDISNDRPLLSPGSCQWEAVQSSEVPPFYSRPPHRRGYPGGEVDLNGNRSPVTESQPPEDADRSERNTRSHGSRRRPRSSTPDSPRRSRRRTSSEEEGEVSASEAAERSELPCSRAEDEDLTVDPENTPRRTSSTRPDPDRT